MASMAIAYFSVRSTSGSEVLAPEAVAGNGWGAARMRGAAVSGALARASENALTATGRADLHPARWTLDLLRPATMQPCTATATVLREGRRLCLIDAVLRQDDTTIARSSALFLKPGGVTTGTVWSPPDSPLPPPPELEPTSREPRLYYSEDVGWTASPGPHQTETRKMMWFGAMPVVMGEPVSAFQFVASVADATSTVTNWGNRGLEYINADVMLALARLPSGRGVGLSVLSRVEHDGISVGTAVVFDRDGVIGSSTVSSVANAAHPIDLTRRVPGAEQSG